MITAKQAADAAMINAGDKLVLRYKNTARAIERQITEAVAHGRFTVREANIPHEISDKVIQWLKFHGYTVNKASIDDTYLISWLNPDSVAAASVCADSIPPYLDKPGD